MSVETTVFWVVNWGAGGGDDLELRRLVGVGVGVGEPT